MIFFFDSALNIVEIKNEISFSYSKKANTEGSGKIELLEIPLPNSFYISIYAGEEYIASGFIKDISKEDKKVSVSFSTFETLLKNHKLPKVFSNFQGMKKADVLVNLFYSFLPIIKSKKKDFSSLSDPYGKNANEIAGVLRAQNIVFSKIKNGDFHLSFDPLFEKVNEFRYNTFGFIVFHFDLGCENLKVKQTYKINGAEYTREKSPERFLRFTADIGNKAYIKVKAVEKDTRIINWTDVSDDFEKAPFLKIDKSIKDFEKNIGVKLPNTKRYLAIQFVFVYDMPNWIQDFSTIEVYDSIGLLHKRTVRGFTPVLHGFEILNRLPISPFSFDSPKIIFEGNSIINDSIITPYEEKFLPNNAKIKFDSLSLADALFKFLEETKMRIEFALKPIANKILDDKGNLKKITASSFFISVFDDDKMRHFLRDKTKTEVLRLHKKEATIFNNYILKTIKKNKKPLKCIHYYGEGEGQDVLHCCLYNKIEFNSVTGEYENNIYFFTVTKYETTPEGVIKIDDKNTVTGIKQSSIFPKDEAFIEEYVEYPNIKDFYKLLQEAINHFRETQKKEVENFEIETNLNIRLYDKVLLLHQESNLQLQAIILEEKISVKKSKMQKTLGVGGFLFNPFDALFEKARIVNFIQIPQTPFNIKAITQNEKLYISWDCYSDVSYFVVKVIRLDNKSFSSNNEIPVGVFQTKTNEIELNSFYLNTLYSFSIMSFIEETQSEESQRLFFRITEEKTPIRILRGLFEEGSFEGEQGFFLDDKHRKKRETIKRISHLLQMSIRKVRQLNHENNVKDKIEKMLEEEQEEVRYFLGLEYVWQKGRWVDKRFKIAKKAPCLYLDFCKNHISSSFYESLFNALKKFFDELCIYEAYRQELQYLTYRYMLPAPNHIELFSLLNKHDEAPQGHNSPTIEGYEPPKPPNDWFDPPVKPGKPIVVIPPQPNNDNRIYPSPKLQLYYQLLKEKYEKKKADVEKLLEAFQNISYMQELSIFDVSGYGHHLKFSIPIFECLDNIWKCQNSFIQQAKPTLDGYNSNSGAYLGCAMRFYWQSTLKDGHINLIYKKPTFFIKQIKQFNTLYSLHGGKKHTLSFYMRFEDGAGRVELWNIQNYNIGFIEKGILHFACRLLNKKTNQFEDFVFYKTKLIDAINTNIEGHNGTLKKDKKFIHILVMASYGATNRDVKVSQKIYIDFKEVPIKNYEKGKESVQVSSRDFDLKYNNDVMFFNFEDIYWQDEKYAFDADNNKPIINPLPRFCLLISNLLLFDYHLSYGERQYIKNCGVYPYKATLDEKGNKVVYRPPQENTQDIGYKGVCVSSINEKSNKVNIYGKGEVAFGAGDYFLMGIPCEPFKAGVIYLWTGTFWKTLLPHSVYHREYSIAYDDIIEMRTLLPELFFKEFITNALLVTQSLYTRLLDANNLVVQKELCLQDLPNGDPHIKGAVYKIDGVLHISEG